MDDKTQKKIGNLVSRVRERIAANERDLHEVQRIIEDTEADFTSYYPFQAIWRFIVANFATRGFMWYLIIVATVAVLFTLFSEPSGTP